MPFIVVRHSERIDEADGDLWQAECQRIFAQVPKAISRSRRSYANDPRITPMQGVGYAQEAAQTLQLLLPSLFPSDCVFEVRLYCSKLRRAVQTALSLASAFRVPLLLCAGLSSVIPAVSKGGFEFMTDSELRADCQDVPYIDCDAVGSGFNLSSDNYVTAIKQLLAMETRLSSSAEGRKTCVVNIIVAHRETLRGLAGRQLNTPYCVIGVFGEEETASSRTSNNSSAISSRGVVVNKTKKAVASVTKPGERQRGGELFPLLSLLTRTGERLEMGELVRKRK